eukprot:scaffold164503_cov34-Tisochrysis_lutea.AAC.3
MPDSCDDAQDRARPVRARVCCVAAEDYRAANDGEQPRDRREVRPESEAGDGDSAKDERGYCKAPGARGLAGRGRLAAEVLMI